MSLFDIIRYTGTDLCSESELRKLPIILFCNYERAVYHYYYPDDIFVIEKTDHKYMIMANWAQNCKIGFPESIFNEELRKYSDEYI